MTSSASAHVLRNFVTDKTTHSVIYDAFVRAFSWSVWIRWKVLIVFVYLMLLLLSYCVNDIIHLKKSINTVSIQYWYMYRSTGDIEMQWFIWRKKNSMRAKPPIIFDAAVLILLKWLYDIRLKKKRMCDNTFFRPIPVRVFTDAKRPPELSSNFPPLLCSEQVGARTS